MKQLTFILLVLATSFETLNGQGIIENLPSFDNKELHFGFTLGTNYANLTTTHRAYTDDNGDSYFADISSLDPGFHVGVISSLRLNNYFNLRFIPSISFTQRNLKFVNSRSNDVYTIPLKSTFIELPFLVKYKAVRDGNAKLYLVAGPSVRVDLARSKKESVLLNPLDIYFEFGIGSDFYLNYFRLGIEARFAIGFTDVMNHSHDGANGDPEPYGKAIDRLTSRLFIIAFNFE